MSSGLESEEESTTRASAILVLAVVVLAIPLGAPPAQGKGPDVTVLVDFGDGLYLWTNVTLPDTNVTALKATELANAARGLPPLEVTWYASPFCLRSPCAFVDDIGDRNPAYPAWWHFDLWNATASAWDQAAYGPSDTDLAEGQAIAWYLAVDDPVTYAAPRPAPTPDFPDVWTSFRGDLANSGRAHGTIPVTNTILWDHDVGVKEVDTTPVVAYGKVFVATRDGLFALDAATGTEAWRNPTVRSLLSTPAVYDGHLVLGGIDGELHFVNASNGTEEWSVLLESGARSTGIASSPAVFEGRAYVGTFNETAGGMGRVAAVNLNNGTVAWTYETGSVHMSQPAIVGRTLYVGVMGVYDGNIGYGAPYGLLSLHLNGTRNWFFPTGGPVASSPAVAGGRVFFTAKDGHLYAVNASGALAWTRGLVSGPSTSSPAVFGDTLYVAAGALGNFSSGSVLAFDLDGEPRPGPTLLFLQGGIQASLITDGRLVCAGTNAREGLHFCLTGSGDLAWAFTPVPHEYILGSPAVVGNTMYAPSDNGHVYAFRDADPSDAPLLELTVDAPLFLTTGTPGRLRITVRGLGRGAAEGVFLRVEFPAGLRLAGERPEDARFPRIIDAPLGALSPTANATREYGVTPLPGNASYRVRVLLEYSDLAGRAYTPLLGGALIASREAPVISATPWLAAVVLVVAAVAAVVVFTWLHRRERPGRDRRA